MYLVWLYMPYRATPLGIFNGGVPEWLKGTDCKSVAYATLVRIQPPPPFTGAGVNVRV